MSLQEKLDKIRSPKLQNQRETAVVLNAVEETLKSQSYDATPTAYFAALLALLSQSVSPSSGIVNKELATSVVYLLDLVAGYVPKPLLRSKFNQILTSIAPVLTSNDVEAPLIRSSIGCLEALLVAQDNSAWALPQTQIGPRRAIAGLLVLAQDHRPKVRKRAQEAITHVLQSPPPSPSVDHPAADMCAETALLGVSQIFDATNANGKKNRKEKRRQGDDHHPGMLHALHLVKTVASASGGWPVKKIEPLCDLLMRLSRGNEWLTMTSFEIFEVIFKGMADEMASSKLPKMMHAIEELKPAVSDERLAPGWCAVISRGYDISMQVEPQETFQKLPAIFDTVKELCASSSHNVRTSASECLVSFMADCIPGDVILEPSVYDEKILEKIARSATDLLSVKYQSAWMEIFTVLSATFSAYKWRSLGLLDELVRIVGELRANDAFNGKKEADEVLGTAIEVMGPEAVFHILPLNLSQRVASQPGRAWLLPILRDHVQNTSLAHFRSALVPLSESMFQHVLDHGSSEKTMEIKIYETLVQQIWATLPGYCTLALDVPSAFDQGFAEMLANLLYQQTGLRTDICNGLQTLVDSNQAVIASELSERELRLQHRLNKDDAQKALNHLAALSGNLLAVLFNVYSQTLPQYRGYILQCINAYLSITPERELLETFNRVTTMLESALKEITPQTQANKQKQSAEQPNSDTMPPTSHTLMDLIITLSIYLPRPTYPTLFSLAALILPQQSDPQLQKKAYKLLPRLASSTTGTLALKDRNAELQTLLIESAASVSAPARRDRLAAIAVVIEHLPNKDLHFIPSLLSEVVLACKEVNEKARIAAFDLLVLMAKKMSAGGTIQQYKILHMDANAPTAQASLEEFFTMVSAGLVGSSPHMISASITALTRVLYEFRSDLSKPVMEDLVQTMSLFLTSTNREIVRSVLGFVKVAIISLPEELVRPRLESLTPGLMSWSHEHKARFRSKVKHILERALRRFGYEVIDRYCPEDDKKLIQNIRKSRERKKKKKDAGIEDGAADGEKKRQGRFESEYDEAIYGSDDSSVASSDEGGVVVNDSDDDGRSSRKGRTNGTYITEADDEPLDLLDRRSLANISSRKPQSVRQPPTKGKRKGKVDIDGKLVFHENDEKDPDEGDDAMSLDPTFNPPEAAGIDAYVSAIRGRDAVQRGRGGRLKFSNKREKHDLNGQPHHHDDMDVDGPSEVRNHGRGGRDRGDGRDGGDGRRKEVRFADRARKVGGVGKRVERRSLGGGKVGGGRVGKGVGRR